MYYQRTMYDLSQHVSQLKFYFYVWLLDCLPSPTSEIILSVYTEKTTSAFGCGEGNGTPLRYYCLENPMDCSLPGSSVHGVAKSQTRLSDFTFTFHFHALEKEMATHSSVLAWRIPGMGEPGGLPSMGLHRVGHDWSDLAAAAAAGLHTTFSYLI